MGPNPLWQLEALLPDLSLSPGDTVLDLGSGTGATSVFLARECGVNVVATDLWIDAHVATLTFADAGVADQVEAVNADYATCRSLTTASTPLLASTPSNTSGQMCACFQPCCESLSLAAGWRCRRRR